jgi:hypothetical protein
LRNATTRTKGRGQSIQEGIRLAIVEAIDTNSHKHTINVFRNLKLADNPNQMHNAVERNHASIRMKRTEKYLFL